MRDKVKKAIVMIEENLHEPLTLEKVAASLGVPAYSLSRYFHQYTGETFKAYQQRRKMAEAGRKIVTTNRRILDIAVDYGFSSQESFHRTFQKVYDETPKRFRRSNKHPSFLFKRPLTDTLIKQNSGFEIVERASFSIRTIGKEFSYDLFDSIIEFWHSFDQEFPQIGGDTYGITLKSDASNEPEHFFYLIGFDQKYEIDGSMTLHIPQQCYVRFTHKGDADAIWHTLNYIWGVWYPANSHRYQFLDYDFEHYPTDFDPNNDDSHCYIYLPIDKE